MSTVDWAMLPRRFRAAVRSVGRARGLLMGFRLLPLSGCHVVLIGAGPPWPLTQHPVRHLLGFVLALVVIVVLLATIDDLVRWVLERRGAARISSGDGRSAGFLTEPHAWDEVGAEFEDNLRGLLSEPVGGVASTT